MRINQVLTAAALVASVIQVSSASHPAIAQGTAGGPAMQSQQGNLPFMRSRERHPELKRSLAALYKARESLQEGARDFNGYRAKALQLTDEAIQQVRMALHTDRT